MAEEAVEQLHRACKDGRVATIRQLLDGGVPVDAPSAAGRTPLHRAIQNKQREAVELLLDRGANIEAGAEGRTPLSGPFGMPKARTSQACCWTAGLRLSQ